MISDTTSGVNYSQIIDENIKQPELTITSSDTYIDSIKLDEFHYHELLDRLHLITVTINDFLLDHPVAQKHKKLSKKIGKALMLLAESYQIVGAMDYEKFDKPLYTQKQVDEMLANAGVLTGKDAEIFLKKIENPKPLSKKVKKRMCESYEKLKAWSETK